MGVFAHMMCLCTSRMPGAHESQKRALTTSLGTGISDSSEWAAIWMLGTEPGSSARAANDLNWAIYLSSPKHTIF